MVQEGLAFHFATAAPGPAAGSNTKNAKGKPGKGRDKEQGQGAMQMDKATMAIMKLSPAAAAAKLRTKTMKLYSELTVFSGKAMNAAAELLKTCNCDTPTQKIQQIMDRNDLLTHLSSDKEMPFNTKDAVSIRECLG